MVCNSLETVVVAFAATGAAAGATAFDAGFSGALPSGICVQHKSINF
jgi:hypothetical protein